MKSQQKIGFTIGIVIVFILVGILLSSCGVSKKLDSLFRYTIITAIMYTIIFTITYYIGVYSSAEKKEEE